MMNNFSRMVVVEVRLTRVEGVMKVEDYRVYKWIIQEIMLLKMKTKWGYSWSGTWCQNK